MAEQGLRYSVVHFFQQHEHDQEQLAGLLLDRLWRLLKEDEVD